MHQPIDTEKCDWITLEPSYWHKVERGWCCRTKCYSCPWKHRGPIHPHLENNRIKEAKLLAQMSPIKRLWYKHLSVLAHDFVIAAGFCMAMLFLPVKIALLAAWKMLVFFVLWLDHLAEEGERDRRRQNDRYYRTGDRYPPYGGPYH